MKRILSTFENNIARAVYNEFSIDDIFDDDAIKEYVKFQFAPEDIFDAEELAKWARENGYE
jgi:hypothetical protein